MREYDHKAIEKKWQEQWRKDELYRVTLDKDAPKYYVLDMFPYPSGEGLHVGHPKGYIATDTLARQKHMQGFNVLHPMGWDAFGLPAENYALKHKVHPRTAVEQNIKRFKEQLEKIGFTYDWNREINTTDPAYYKWTQWIFVQLFKKGLAYESHEPINWCPTCKTGLANEDVEDGKCERCGTLVEKKPLRQWVLKIREYADRLLEDIDELDWPESIKISQKNWIGKSEGAELTFTIKDTDKDIAVFTTRPDTLFGVTYMVLAPEHPLLEQLQDQISNFDEVQVYQQAAAQLSEIERTSEAKEKTGVRLEGVTAINPANNEEVPIFIADYVLSDYGTGAIMAVPAHDERDHAFAEKYGLPLKEVVDDGGSLIHSGEFNGVSSEDAKEKIVSAVGGEMRTSYKLRDWVFSRQRYWGEPIPIIHCEKCGPVPVPEEQLPVELPDVESYEPTGTGESPLADITEWVNTACPTCGGEGKRETNTMPQWAGSSWYYLRYMDSDNGNELVGKDTEKYWAPVDMYVGGAEHATRHLIYARFWHKFLYDLGVVSTEEPFKKLQHVGLINAADGRKMSKRWGNVINPDEVVDTLGADTLRVYEMFMGPFDQAVSWSEDGIVGPRRFLEKVWRIQEKVAETSDLDEAMLHKTIKKVTEDIPAMRFNTAISQLMIFVNHIESAKSLTQDQYKILLQLLHPFAPHITEELWNISDGEGYIYNSVWPQYDESLLQSDTVKLAIQINGKVRDEIEAASGVTEEELKEIVLAREAVQKWIDGKEIKKCIYVENKLISIVI